MSRLPVSGQDDGVWGDILNDFLTVEHNADGTLKKSSIITGAEQATNKGAANGYAPLGSDSKVPGSNLPTGTLSGLSDTNISGPANSQVLSYDTASSKWIPATVSSTTVSDADSGTKGIVKLAGDLGGTAAVPTVPGLATKADDASVVHKAVNETITGDKNFSGAVTISGQAAVATNDARLTDTRTPTDSSVTAAKIVNGIVSAAKLDSTVNGYLTSAQSAVQTVNGKSGTSVSLTASDVSAAASSRNVSAGTGLSGGGDLTADRTLNVTADSTTQRLEVAAAGSLTGTRKRINFITGTNMTISAVDDTPGNKVDITLASTGITYSKASAIDGGSSTTTSSSAGTATQIYAADATRAGAAIYNVDSDPSKVAWVYEGATGSAAVGVGTPLYAGGAPYRAEKLSGGIYTGIISVISSSASVALSRSQT